jgi:hypothetical protein
MVSLAGCVFMAESDHSTGRAYLTTLAALVQADPARLTASTRARVTEILDARILDARAAEDMISDLAEDDEQLAALWDQAQREQPDATRGPEIFAPQRRHDGPTHDWVCPVAGCPTTEKGLGWGTISGVTRCAKHGAELTPVRIPGT